LNFTASRSAVVHGFQSFYYELLRQKERALSLYFRSTSPVQLDQIKDGNTLDDAKTPSEAEGAVVTIQKKLIDIINSAFEAISAKSKLSQGSAIDAKYVMSSLADEIFINLRWDGAKYWRFSLIEKQLFQSEVAGDKFFIMLDKIIYDLDNSNEEMVFLYLMSLNLGFKGRYRDIEESNDHIAWYKDRLYSILHSKSSRLFYPGRNRMIESCYEYTDSEQNDSELPDTKFWSFCITSVVVAYILISYCVWYSMTNDIEDILEKIVEQTRKCPLI
jgi:type IV/VI secretion system ImpK/VasF family protein